jgi:uncharacterized protein (DUF427 family)
VTGSAPCGRVRAEPGAKRVRAYLGGDLVADTTRPLLVWEHPRFPVYYIPLEDVRAELVPTGEREHSPSRGQAEVCDVRTDNGRAPASALRFGGSPLADLEDSVRIEWSAMDEWLEEDEPVYTHPRDPYTRVDALSSSRHVRVVVDGVIVAESTRPVLLFETGLPVRYYLPLPDVRLDLLVKSSRKTHCPYKGTAAYWSLQVDDKAHDDVVWIYRTPLPECWPIADMACFYNERTEIWVDGELDPSSKRARSVEE